MLGNARHPLGTSDLSSLLLQARSSRAKVIGLANAGADTYTTVHTIPGEQAFRPMAEGGCPLAR